VEIPYRATSLLSLLPLLLFLLTLLLLRGLAMQMESRWTIPAPREVGDGEGRNRGRKETLQTKRRIVKAEGRKWLRWKHGSAHPKNPPPSGGGPDIRKYNIKEEERGFFCQNQKL
jgi:hypothetical protein